jgi:hypothetical protein
MLNSPLFAGFGADFGCDCGGKGRGARSYGYRERQADAGP